LPLSPVSALAAGPAQPVMRRASPVPRVAQPAEDEDDVENSGPLSDYDDPFDSDEPEK
jgi:hypothetical protein